MDFPPALWLINNGTKNHSHIPAIIREINYRILTAVTFVALKNKINLCKKSTRGSPGWILHVNLEI